MGIGILKVSGMRYIDLNNNKLIRNIRYSPLLQQKIERGKNFLKNCNRYTTSIENMENEKPYTRRENGYFLKQLYIKKLFFNHLY